MPMFELKLFSFIPKRDFKIICRPGRTFVKVASVGVGAVGGSAVVLMAIGGDVGAERVVSEAKVQNRL